MKTKSGVFTSRLVQYALTQGDCYVAHAYLIEHAPKMSMAEKTKADEAVVAALAKKYGVEAHLSEGKRGLFSGFTFSVGAANQALKRARNVLRGGKEAKSAKHVDPLLRLAKALAKLSARDRSRVERMAEKIAAE